MLTYRELFAADGLKAMCGASWAAVAASTLTGLALGTLLYDRTGSPLLSALGMFGSSFGELAGAVTLMSLVDRWAPRGALVWLTLIASATSIVMALPGLGVSVLLSLTLAMGVASSLAGAVRYGLLTDILTTDGYVLGRSVLNMGVGVMQIGGYACGAVLLQAMSTRSVLLVAAVLYVSSALVFRVGLSEQAPRSRSRGTVGRTWRVNRALLAGRPVRTLFLASWLPNGLVVGAEALFVPYAERSAGTLFVAGALGMLAGDAAAGRLVPPGSRFRVMMLARLLLPAPYLLFFTHPPVPIAAGFIAVASLGYGATLLQQERLVALVPESAHGQALGLQSSGMIAMQALGASAAGAAAELVGTGTAMTCMALGSVAVSVALTPGLRAAAAT